MRSKIIDKLQCSWLYILPVFSLWKREDYDGTFFHRRNWLVRQIRGKFREIIIVTDYHQYVTIGFIFSHHIQMYLEWVSRCWGTLVIEIPHKSHSTIMESAGYTLSCHLGTECRTRYDSVWLDSYEPQITCNNPIGLFTLGSQWSIEVIPLPIFTFDSLCMTDKYDLFFLSIVVHISLLYKKSHSVKEGGWFSLAIHQ